VLFVQVHRDPKKPAPRLRPLHIPRPWEEAQERRPGTPRPVPAVPKRARRKPTADELRKVMSRGQVIVVPKVKEPDG
jgi:hypothetical protein